MLYVYHDDLLPHAVAAWLAGGRKTRWNPAATLPQAYPKAELDAINWLQERGGVAALVQHIRDTPHYRAFIVGPLSRRFPKGRAVLFFTLVEQEGDIWALVEGEPRPLGGQHEREWRKYLCPHGR